MNPPPNQRRRDRPRGVGDPGGVPNWNESDPLVRLRGALQNRHPAAFADCFAEDGWLRVPRPEGDIVLLGADQIARAGYELREMLDDLTWTPSQRFLAAGQVVEEAVVRARPNGAPADGIRVSMRAVSDFEPDGRIASLTLWIDWAALNDPLGVQSARGAASALVAAARAQDTRGLRVIKGAPWTSSLPVIPVREPVPVTVNRSVRPPAGVLWWRQHRRTLAGTVMAVLAVVVLSWVARTVLDAPTRSGSNGDSAAGAHPTATGAVGGGRTGNGGASAGKGGRNGQGQSGPGASAGIGSGQVGGVPGSGTGSGTGSGAGSGTGSGTGSGAGVGAGVGQTSGPDVSASDARLPTITQEQPSVEPTVQPGKTYALQADFLFERDSFRLSPSAQKVLQNLAMSVQAKHVHGVIQINGYTDNRGTVEHNRKLSRSRALAVAEALQSYLTGSTDLALNPQAFGESHAFATNSTAAGRSQNRRVVVVLPKN